MNITEAVNKITYESNVVVGIRRKAWYSTDILYVSFPYRE